MTFHDGDRLQRRGGLLQLRPLVQLQRRPAEPRGRPTTGRPCSAASPRTRTRRSARACTSVLRGHRRGHRGHHPDRASSSLPVRPGAAVVLDREPDGARGVRRRRGQRHRRGAGVRGHLRQREPGRHRPVQVRVLGAAADRLTLDPLRRLLGRAGAARQGHLPPDPGRPGPPPGPRGRRDRGLRPGRPGRRRRARGRRLPDPRRPAFNVGYVGFNQQNAAVRQPQDPPGDRPRDRPGGAAQTNYPAGAEVATQFMPPELFGWSRRRHDYDYDPEKAKALIAESGVTDLTLEFWYPTDVSRPYMPNPQANFELIKADLEAVGFTVDAEVGAVEPGLPRRRADRRHADVPARAGPATSVTRTTSSGRSSSSVNPQSAASTNRRSSPSSTRPRRRPTWTARTAAVPGGQPS